MFVKLFGNEIFITTNTGFARTNLFSFDKDKSLFGVDTHIHILGVYIIVSRNFKA